MLDIHSHILPGVDDGARAPAESFEMLRKAKECGITTIIATPHLYEPVESIESYREKCAAINAQARAQGIRVLLGFEVNYRVLSKVSMQELTRYCVEGTNCILLELSSTLLFPNWQSHLCEISETMRPIIVHPERCRFLHSDPQLLTEMRGYGCEIQVDFAAFSMGMFAQETRRAKGWLANDEIDYIASDAHSPEHYESFSRFIRAKRTTIPHNGILHEMLHEG